MGCSIRKRVVLVNSVAFSDDDEQLASALEDKTVKVWDMALGKCLQTLNVSATLYNILFDTANQNLRAGVGAIALDVSKLKLSCLH
jgi:WD40 repeat protein